MSLAIYMAATVLHVYEYQEDVRGPSWKKAKTSVSTALCTTALVEAIME
jgi:hypothetical protein